MYRRISYKDDGIKVKIKFHCCDLCGVGAGITKYAYNVFRHTQEKLVKYVSKNKHEYELCDSCLETVLRNPRVGKNLGLLIDFDILDGVKKKKTRKNKRLFKGSLYV